MLGWTAVVVGSAYWILTSRWGRAFRAIRENEMRAEALGVSLRNYKLMAFAIGAAYAGIGGALFAPLLGYIDPGAYTLDRSIQFLMMVVMGGLGRFEGPFIGAILVTVLPEVLRASEGLYLVIYALAVILMMLFMPKGLVGVWDWALSRLGPRRGGRAPAGRAARRAPGGLSGPLMPLLEVRGLTKQFFRLSALSGVSLSVEPGELLGVIGPNGSGKTTLFNCVTGVLRPSAGQVRFKGEDITGLSADLVYRRGIARTFQLIQLFPEMTVLENMLLAAQEREGTLARPPAPARGRPRRPAGRSELLEYLGIAASGTHLASNLSYGQQKLLDFGMALMSRPEVILLDEPLAGVNPTMIKSLVGHIQALNAQGHTFVVIEHNMEVVMSLCRRIVVLSQGERIAEGTPAEVADNPLVLDAYFGR